MSAGVLDDILDEMADYNGPVSPMDANDSKDNSSSSGSGSDSERGRDSSEHKSNRLNQSVFNKTTSAMQDTPYGKTILPRKERNWLDRYRKKELLEFSRAGEAKKSRKKQGYYLHIRKVTGALIPACMEGLNRENIYYRIQISFFDVKARKFFGRTAVDENFPIAHPKEDITLEHRPFVFFSSIHDENCIGVAEYVVMEKKDGVVTQQFSVGWTTLNLFGLSANSMTDVADASVHLREHPHNDSNLHHSRKENYQLKPPIVRFFFRGSPRALLFIDFTRPDWATDLPRAKSAKLWYEFFVYKKLKSFFHLMRENEIIKERDIIPGMPSSTLSDGDTMDDTVDFGDSRYDNKKFRLPANPKKLRLYKLPNYSVKVQRPVIHLPVNFEDKLLWSMRQTREGHWEGDSAKIKSVNRVLHIGVHNGLTFVHSPASFTMKPVESAKHGVRRLEYRGDYELSDLLCEFKDNPYVAVTFELEYTINWKNSASGHPSYSSVTVGWTVRMLANDKDMKFSGRQFRLCLQRGVGRSLRNNRVFGWADTDAVTKRGVDSLQDEEHGDAQNIWLDVALKSPAMDTIQKALKRDGFYSDGEDDSDSDSDSDSGSSSSGGSGSSSSGSSGSDSEEGEEVLGSPKRIYRQPKQLKTPKNKNYRNPNNPDDDEEYDNFPQASTIAPISVRVDSDSDQHQRNLRDVFDNEPHNDGHISPYKSPKKLRHHHKHHHSRHEQEQQHHGGQVDAQFPHSSGNNLDVTVGPLQDTNVDHTTTQINVGDDLNAGEVNVKQELSDPFKGAEFCIVLRKFSQPHSEFLKAPVRSVMFSFTFGQELTFVSDRIPLLVAHDKHAADKRRSPLKKHNKKKKHRHRHHGHGGHDDEDEEGKLHSMGDYHSFPFNVTYRFHLEPHHHRTFVEYLYQGSLTINVWNADSLFLIGEARLPLRPFLRQGQSVIQKKAVVDVTSVPTIAGSKRSLHNHHNAAIAAAAAQDEQIRTENLQGEGEHAGKLEVLVAHRAYRLTSEESTLMESLVHSSIPSVNAAVFRLQNHPGDGPQNPNAQLSNDPLNIAINSNVSMGRKVKGHLMIEGEYELASKLHGLDGSLFITPNAAVAAAYDKQAYSKEFNRKHKHHDRVGSPTKSKKQHELNHKPINLQDALSASYGATEIKEMKLADKTRVADLRKIKSYRNQKKVISIPSQIRNSITQRRTIYPAFAQLTFFEVAFTNPFPKRAKFVIHIRDPLFNRKNHHKRKSRRHEISAVEEEAPDQAEMQVVTDVKEWTYLKRQYGLNTPTKVNMFYKGDEFSSAVTHPEKAEEEKEDDPNTITIMLDRRETVYIPFKFQSFRAGRVPVQEPSERPGKVVLVSDANASAIPRVPGVVTTPQFAPVATRSVEIEISRRKELLAMMDVAIEPKNFPIDRSLRFHYWADQMIEQELPLPSVNSNGGFLRSVNPAAYNNNNNNNNNNSNATFAAEEGMHMHSSAHISSGQAHLLLNTRNTKIMKARCTNDDVAFEFVQGGPHEETKIMFKYSGDRFPEVTRMYFVLYTDAYNCNVFGIYEVFLHAHLHCEMDSVLVGQATMGKLTLPALDRRRNVQLFASSSEITFRDHGKFQVEPHEVGEVKFRFRTQSDGLRNVLVNLVDTRSHELLLSWVVVAKCAFPRISQRYKIKLRAGQGSNKNFDWKNKYNRTRSFFFDCSNPDVLSFQQKKLKLSAQSKGIIRLTINPRDTSGTEVVYVFVNDDKGRTEECLQFHIDWLR